jgi:molybdopterin-binding protein
MKGKVFMPTQMSARNQLKAVVKSVKLGEVMAEVVVELSNGEQIVSAITRGSVETMNIRQGDRVTAIIKSTEVMIGKDA